MWLFLRCSSQSRIQHFTGSVHIVKYWAILISFLSMSQTLYIGIWSTHHGYLILNCCVLFTYTNIKSSIFITGPVILCLKLWNNIHIHSLFISFDPSFSGILDYFFKSPPNPLLMTGYLYLVSSEDFKAMKLLSPPSFLF